MRTQYRWSGRVAARYYATVFTRCSGPGFQARRVGRPVTNVTARPGTGRHDSREFAIVGKIDLSQFAGVASSNTIFDFKHLLLIIYCN